jgi:hypothetical protein
MTPQNLPISRVRGDTFPFTFTLRDSAGTAVNITGNTFLLTVDTREEPTDASTLVFQATGVVSVGTDGKVTFTLTTPQAATTPGDYFYDLQMTSGSAIRTVAKSTYTVIQDITK